MFAHLPAFVFCLSSAYRLSSFCSSLLPTVPGGNPAGWRACCESVRLVVGGFVSRGGRDSYPVTTRKGCPVGTPFPAVRRCAAAGRSDHPTGHAGSGRALPMSGHSWRRCGGIQAAGSFTKRQTGGSPSGPWAQVDQFGVRWSWPLAFLRSSVGARSRWRYRSISVCGSGNPAVLRFEEGNQACNTGRTSSDLPERFPARPV